MFLFKKIISPLLLPFTLCLALLIIGIVLVWFQRKGRSGKILLTIGVLLLALLSYNVVAGKLIMPLECKYPPIQRTEADGARWIVILGGGAEADGRFPATSLLTDDSLSRLVEGIRLHRELPGSKLLLSGGPALASAPEAKTMAEAATELGVNHRDLVMESSSRDTEEQAEKIRDIVGKNRFILVTSAYHMPRAMALFQKAQMHPIAAPARPCITNQKLSPRDFYPNPRALEKSETAVHEYLGILWAKLRGRI